MEADLTLPPETPPTPPKGPAPPRYSMFYSSENKRIYILKSNGYYTINPLPVGLPVTLIEKPNLFFNNSPGKIIEIKDNKYDVSFDAQIEEKKPTNQKIELPFEMSDFRFNPDLVETIYDKELRTISFKPKESSGGKNARISKRKINKKRKSNKKMKSKKRR